RTRGPAGAHPTPDGTRPGRPVSALGSVGRMAGRSVTAATTVAATALAVPSVYLGVVSAAAFIRRRSPSVTGGPTTRIAVMVPAHNEAVVIGEALAAFDRLHYPAELFSVHVVADN